MRSRTSLILAAVLLAAARPAAQDRPAPPPAAEPSGIFVEAGAERTRLQSASSADIQTSGVMKSVLTQGLSKPKHVITHEGAAAPTTVAVDAPVFLFRFPPPMNSRTAMSLENMQDMANGLPPMAENPKDFTLARMTVAGDARTIDTGKIEKVDFDVKKIANREFRVTLKTPLTPGEYAFYYSKHGGVSTQIWAFSYRPS